MQNDQDSRKIRRVGKDVPAAPQIDEQYGTAQDFVQPSEAAKQAADAAVQRHLAREQAQDEGKMPRAGKRRKKKMGRTGRVILWVLLALLVVGGVSLAKFYYDISHPQSLFQEETATPAPSATPADATPGIPTPTPTPDPSEQLLSQADLEFMKNRVNILMLGIDESTERANWGSFRTDTMILVSIDFDTSKVDMISIPRDSYVKICNGSGKVRSAENGAQYGKINSAFPTGGGAQKNGFEYAMGTVSYLLGGIPIQYYVGFNMNVVKQVVDAMGGVDYDVDIEVNMNGRKLLPGMQHMDGQAVLDYSRQRKGSSDIARVDRQQRILFAIFSQLKSTGQIVHLPEIYQAVEQNIQTNLSFKQISSLALLAMQMDTTQLGRHTVDGEFLNMYGISYWGLHTGKLETMIKEIFGISVSLDSDVNASNVRAQIQANRALIAAELAAANAAIENANYILGNFDAWLADGTRSQLKSAKSQLEDAVEAEDKALLDTYTAPLAQLCDTILAQLQSYGALDGAARPEVTQTPLPEDAIPELDEPVG